MKDVLEHIQCRIQSIYKRKFYALISDFYVPIFSTLELPLEFNAFNKQLLCSFEM